VPLSIVIFAIDVERVSTFYQKVCGLTVVENEKSHQRLMGDASEIVVHQTPGHIKKSLTIEPGTIRKAVAIKPVLTVDSLETVQNHCKTLGGGLKPIDSAWDIRGHWVLDGHDPEGNVIQFRQPH